MEIERKEDVQNGVLDTPPHIPSGSERNGRIPSGSEQILSGMVGIRVESERNGRNGWNLVGMRTHPNFTWTQNHSDQIPSRFRPVLPNSEWNHSYFIKLSYKSHDHEISDKYKIMT